jgi:hypothetical protein
MRVCALVLAIVLASCSRAAAGPSPTPTPSGNALPQAELKYLVVEQFGRPFFCDPDVHPVARADEQGQADARFAEIQKDASTFNAILAHKRIAPAASYSAAQRLAIYRDWKMLNALQLEPVSAGFRFAGVFDESGSATAPQYSRVEGTINARGKVTNVTTAPGAPPACPICLARGTRIATPYGDALVETLRLGDIVWTLDARGTRAAAPIVALGSTPAPETHVVVRVLLSDGRTVDVSPGHVAADGRRVGDLRVDDTYDGARVTSVDRIRYAGEATFDLLPDGATGTYWANGILLGSTLAR